MGGVKRGKQMELEERLTKVAAYVRGGVTNQTQLARLVGVSQQTISRDLRKVEERFQQAALEDILVAKGKDLERVEAMIRGLWPDAQSGKWLAVDRVSRLLEFRAKVMGYEAVNRMEISGPGGGPIQTEDAAPLPTHLRDEVYLALKRAVEGEDAGS